MEDFDTLMTHITALETLTEKKIDAATSRDATQLVQLLQEELDSMDYVNQHLFVINDLSLDQRQIIRHHAASWHERTLVLAEILQTQLGYCDFVRTLIGQSMVTALNLDL